MDEGIRIEFDSIGEKKVPRDALYGVQTLRAAENFHITGLGIHPEMIKSLASIKKAAAITNLEVGVLERDIALAIIAGCDEIIAGNFLDQFIVDPIQGGAGTSLNMNANEVIANYAISYLGGEKGDYNLVSPNDHVNCAQSTNDVFPSCGKITAIKLLNEALEELRRLQLALKEKAKEFDHIIKMGRTQLQDAVPIRLGQEFEAYSRVVDRDIVRFKEALKDLSYLNMGGTAIGTGLNANARYMKNIVSNLAKVCDLDLYQSEDLIDGTQNLDCFSYVSGIIKTCAINLSKIASDLRLMSSGPKTGFGEINLPKKQNGSSIMPGKVNPVIPEVINQIAFNIVGNDLSISLAVESGQLELNAFEPIIFYNLFQSIETLTCGIRTFVDNCVVGITANEERCKTLVSTSIGVITALCPYIGYVKATELAKEAMCSNVSLNELLIERNIMSEEELSNVLEPYKMTCPKEE